MGSRETKPKWPSAIADITPFQGLVVEDVLILLIRKGFLFEN
jgi:hypothetical protein